MKKLLILSTAVLFFIGCETTETPADRQNNTGDGHSEIPLMLYDSTALFPGDGSLSRCEDGVGLEDGNIVVADVNVGLRLVLPDGSSRPYGHFEESGFTFDTPEQPAAPNGVFIEADRSHIYMSDVITGKVYRVATADESVELIYEHHYGVNTLFKDSRGTIWLSQSTNNSPESGQGGVFKDVGELAANGAVYRLTPAPEGKGFETNKMAEGIYFANGITMDPEEEYLYLSETMMDRVLRFKVSEDGMELGPAKVFCKVPSPDNITFGPDGDLWVASPFSNGVYAFDPSGTSSRLAFHAPSEANAYASAQADVFLRTGQSVMPLFATMTEPLPGLCTGLFFSADNKTLYIANLGNDLLKYPLP